MLSMCSCALMKYPFISGPFFYCILKNIEVYKLFVCSGDEFLMGLFICKYFYHSECCLFLYKFPCCANACEVDEVIFVVLKKNCITLKRWIQREMPAMNVKAWLPSFLRRFTVSVLRFVMLKAFHVIFF